MIVKNILLIFIFNILMISLSYSTTFTTVKNGTWTDASVWDSGTMPLLNDTIIIKHFVQAVNDIVMDAPGYLKIDQDGTLCGRFLDLEINCDARCDNYGNLYIDRLLVHGIARNYGYIEFTVNVIISGPCPSGTSFSNSGGGSINIIDSVTCSITSGVFNPGYEEKYNIRFIPNPAYDYILLKLNLPCSKYFTLLIYNIEGGVSKTLMDKRKVNKGKQEIKFNIGELPPGIYVCRLQIDGYVINKKIVVLKK